MGHGVILIKTLRGSIGGAGFILAICTLVGTGIMTTTYMYNKDRIKENERLVLLRTLSSVLVPGTFNNDVINDTIEITEPQWLGSKKPLTVYRARMNGVPVASVLSIVVPDGYNGPIKAIVGINIENEIIGVRVISHKETPGLGDAIEVRKSDWILSFNGRGTHNTTYNQWAVKKDGGQFDQFTGATITPRAIVKAVHRSVQYFSRNSQTIFKNPDVSENDIATK